MKHVNSIIVGSGIAAISMVETLRQQGKSYHIFSDQKPGATHVAAGVYNPVVLKRFNPVWKAGEQLDVLERFYPIIEKRLDIKVDYKISVRRKLFNEKEQKTWVNKARREDLNPFMDPEIIYESNDGIEDDFGYGLVKRTGRIDTTRLLQAFHKELQQEDAITNTHFNHNSLEINEEIVKYGEISGDGIIFCEGEKVRNNPFFNHLPLQENKGELLELEIPDLQIDFLLKGPVFVLPVGNGLFHVGATYSREFENSKPTKAAKEEILRKLETFVTKTYKVIHHKSGIRPTVPDRRPLIGPHHKYNNLYCFNGMGSRGVLIGPWAAQQLYNAMYINQPLHPEIDCNRYAP